MKLHFIFNILHFCTGYQFAAISRDLISLQKMYFNLKKTKISSAYNCIFCTKHKKPYFQKCRL